MTATRRKRDIDSHSVYLSDMLKHVRAGQLLPAAFQRRYVWKKKDVLKLITSLLEGFPIGSFLLWSPWGAADVSEAGRHRLGPIVGSSTVPSSQLSFLLDGQNRLTTMAWLTRELGDPLPPDLEGIEKETWGSGEHLVLDLAKKRIRFVPESEVNVGFKLPIAAVFNGRLNQEMRLREGTQWAGVSTKAIDEGMVWIDTVREKFTGAKIIVTDIQYATFDEAREAFLHICKLGVPMTRKDFQAALSWAAPKKS